MDFTSQLVLSRWYGVNIPSIRGCYWPRLVETSQFSTLAHWIGGELKKKGLYICSRESSGLVRSSEMIIESEPGGGVVAGSPKTGQPICLGSNVHCHEWWQEKKTFEKRQLRIFYSNGTTQILTAIAYTTRVHRRQQQFMQQEEVFQTAAIIAEQVFSAYAIYAFRTFVKQYHLIQVPDFRRANPLSIQCSMHTEYRTWMWGISS